MDSWNNKYVHVDRQRQNNNTDPLKLTVNYMLNKG